MNIDGVEYYTTVELAAMRQCSIVRIRQILGETRIVAAKQIGALKLYTDTQAALVTDYYNDGTKTGRPPMMTAYDVLCEITGIRRLANTWELFRGNGDDTRAAVNAMYAWCDHARRDCPVKTRGMVKQQISGDDATLVKLPAWRKADHDAVMAWAIADLQIK